ncbi:hypothetical protein GIB67_041989 [Kingdonia uniflora]|uniref:Cysteine--tRNA ligase n=1 Tax=Kingdonia uniflora TaxID=39325 RepID=A0A7J7NZP4_9MAGN|nr:hypothetical protein GIB67_041989 [Kingdonia uniflora]
MKEIPEFYIYNTMTRQKELFKPKEEGKVGMYVCGITSYDFSHIGHVRSSVVYDVFYRYLKYLGYERTYVCNFTDVDDKIIVKANLEKKDPLLLSSYYCQVFMNDMADLQCLPPTYQPRVSTHMDQIRQMIAKLSDYSRLSGRKLEDQRAGARIAIDLRKQIPVDFALWKAAKPSEPSWDSPWGHGRPGWHIECSAMSTEYLTSSFDIHGGGTDLIFPHHENEISQSYAADSESKVTYWMHNGQMTKDGKKMSKSLGNTVPIREVTEHYHPLALRYLLMSVHYRSPMDYTKEQIEIASESLYYIYQVV